MTTPDRPDEFFIGYQSETPTAARRAMRGVVVALAVLAVALALALTAGQRGEEAAVFEFGNETVLEGRLLDAPEPLLLLPSGRAVLLIGYGKHGAWPVLEDAGFRPGQTLAVAGTLIYHDGRTLMEITRGAEALRRAEVPAADRREGPDELLGPMVLEGEIVDPKCFFGVMKPGEGKPHRACAIRCIEGGIPPVLVAERREAGTVAARAYFLVRGASGEALNDRVGPHVAVPLRVSGTVERWADWYLLRSDPGDWGVL